MERNVNELADTLMKEAYNKRMLFEMYEYRDDNTYYITASPAALKVFAAELIEASEHPLGSEIEVDLDKYFGEKAFPLLLSITVTETEKKKTAVKENPLIPIGCGIIVLAILTTFLLGLSKIYEMIF